MSVTLDTRKPVVELTTDDLAAFTVWEFALDEEGVEGQDETWVRPLDSRVVPPDEYSLIVAADFHASGGSSYDGFCIVTTAGQAVEVDAGVLLVGAHYLPIDLREELLSSLHLSQPELFPLTYELRPLLKGERFQRRGSFI